MPSNGRGTIPADLLASMPALHDCARPPTQAGLHSPAGSTSRSLARQQASTHCCQRSSSNSRPKVTLPFTARREEQGRAGQASLSHPVWPPNSGLSQLLVDEQTPSTRDCQAAHLLLCEPTSPVALMIQACCAAYARRPPTATRPLSRSISPSSAWRGEAGRMPSFEGCRNGMARRQA